jgi:hypothetical protein
MTLIFWLDWYYDGGWCTMVVWSMFAKSAERRAVLPTSMLKLCADGAVRPELPDCRWGCARTALASPTVESCTSQLRLLCCTCMPGSRRRQQDVAAVTAAVPFPSVDCIHPAVAQSHAASTLRYG